MDTLALINQKGGVGKTTIAIHLATSYSMQGRNVVMLDLDPQASAMEWGDARTSEFPHVQSIQPVRLAKTIEKIRAIGTDVLILDTAPHLEATALDAARAADLVLVPCQPSIMDIRAMTKTVAMLKLVNVPAFAVMNAVQHHSKQVAEEAAATITSHLGLPVAPFMIGNRVLYSRCLITGQAAQEIEPNSKAAGEIMELAFWVRSILKKAKAV